ncbi:AAA family ATPase [Streptosporangium sp. G11]|uniref:ATP-binding protein n=1 Tax=Streptosporangium sp. G11 TaxID=3436926 RepID=UPI003EBCB89C
MIGRAGELDQLNRLAATVTTSGAVAVVAGEPGIGKTRLMEEFAQASRANGFRELRCTGLENESHAGFAGLHELIHPVLDHAAALPARQRQALLTAFGLAEGPAPERLLISLAVLGLLEEATTQQPLLLVVEDMHWLDPSTAEVVRFLARRLSGAPIMLLVTVRAQADDPEPLRSLPGLRLDLGPLSEADSTCLLDLVAGDLTPASRTRLLQEAGGNPLALQELPIALRERGLAADQPFLSPLPTTRRLEQAFLTRVGALPTASQQLLLLAAAEGELTLADLIVAARRTGLTVGDLDPLERSRLVEVRQDRVRFCHPLLRSAVLGAASSTKRAEVHRLLAAIVQDPVRAVWHRAMAAYERDEELAAELEAAGLGAAQRGALAEAAAVLRRAAALSPEAAPRARRLAKAAELSRQAGRTHDVVEALQQARPLATQAEVLVELMSTEIANSLMTGMPAASERDIVALARQMSGPDGDRHRVERIRLLWAAAVQITLRSGGQNSAADVLSELAEADPQLKDPLQLIGLALLDPLKYAARVRSQLDTLQPPALAEPRALLSLGLAAEAMQDLPTAFAALEAGRMHLNRAGALADESHLLAWLACQRVLMGTLCDAVADAEMAERMAVDLALPAVAAAAGASGALGLAWLGQQSEAELVLARVRERPEDALWTSTTARAAWAAGHLALQKRSYRQAWLELSKVSVHRTTALWALGDFVEAAVRSGKGELARLALDSAERDAAVLDSPHLDMLVQRGRALLTTDDKADAYFHAALERGVDAVTVLERARTQLVYGQWLRRERRVMQAREQLAAALDTFQERGAELWADQAAAELRAAGVAPARRLLAAGRLDATVLTPQEIQIAGLAAAGLTNKEIADRLYLSHRTVGAHLYKVFPKLGITSRAQLREVTAKLEEPERQP